jgi:hypothetical protein
MEHEIKFSNGIYEVLKVVDTSNTENELTQVKRQLQKTIVRLEQFRLREHIREEYPDAVHNIRAAANLFTAAINEIDCNVLSQLTDQSSSNIQDELNTLAELLTLDSSDYVTSVLQDLAKQPPPPPRLATPKDV